MLYVIPGPVGEVTVIVPVEMSQVGSLRDTDGAAGISLIVTTISDLGPSQLLPLVWLTQYEVLPAVVVEGVGAVVLPVPPVAVVYHNSPVPVAVRALAVSFWQYVTSVVTAGASGVAFTVTVTCELTVADPSLTSTR
jgi:hypothetical protein